VVACPEIQGIRVSREFADGLVLQPEVVQEAVQLIRDAHLRFGRKERQSDRKSQKFTN
jgi:hypothetical protein